jgi:ABC-type glycerol-3-phosphate transport system permease component
MRAHPHARPVLIYASAALCLVFTLGPVFYMLTISLRPNEDIYLKPFPFIPPRPTLSNYVDVLLGRTVTDARLLESIGRTLVVALASTFCAVVLATLAGYSLARFRFRGRELFGLGLLATQMMPAVLFLVPLFVILRQLHLTNNLGGLTLSYLTFALPFCIWMLRGYFANIPPELEEAAMVDGSTRLQALLHVILPLAAPALAATATFAFINAWNEFLFAFILGGEIPLVTVSLYAFVSQYGPQYGNLMAAAVLVGLPPVVLFVLLQRFLIQGLTAGAVKH